MIKPNEDYDALSFFETYSLLFKIETAWVTTSITTTTHAVIATNGVTAQKTR